MAGVAERAGLPREGVYRALSPRGNPALKTLLALLPAATQGAAAVAPRRGW